MKDNKDFDLNAIVLNDETNNDGAGPAPKSISLSTTLVTTIIASASAVTESVKNCSMSSCKGAKC